MPNVTINDKQYEGMPGERLVDIARNNGAHFGFLCDGVGFCQLCTCRVEEGSEHLSPPTDMERNWLQESMLNEGYRMACQTTIRGAGPISILSRAEEIRRSLMNVFSPPEGTNMGENVGQFVTTISKYVTNQIGRFPFNVFGSIPIMMRNTPRTPNMPKILGDTSRVVTTMLGIQRNSSTTDLQKPE
jgi:ferredoxin